MLRRAAALLTSLTCVTVLGGGSSAAVVGAAPESLVEAGAQAAGDPGIGDPYFPLDGNGGIDVLRYSVHDRYSFGRKRITGWTRLRIRATQDLSSFNLDLLLDATSVRVEGRKARFHKPDPHELQIKPRRPIATGERFSVVVRYAGFPARLKYHGERNWLANRREVLTMNEPHMAPWWYPANDHPLDKAVHDFHITVPTGKRVVANGLPKGSRSHGRLVTWRWVAKDPMVPYLAFFAAGDFRVAQGRKDGLPWLLAVSKQLPGKDARVAMKWLEQTPALTSWLESELGPYPFESTGGIVTSLNPGFALENQTRPTYPFVGGSSTWLLVHELAHQWFGDSVAVKGWRDIWLNEGFATYLEVRYAETHRGPSAASWLRRAYEQHALGDSFWDLSIGDPGPRRLFDGAVYERGAMTLQALRNLIGGQTFATLLRAWAAQKADSNGSTEEFRALAEQLSGRDLGGFFDAWLVAETKPADTAANGLG